MYTPLKKGQRQLTKETARNVRVRVVEVLFNGLLQIEADKHATTGEKVYRLQEPGRVPGACFYHGTGTQKEMHMLASAIASVLMSSRKQKSNADSE